MAGREHSYDLVIVDGGTSVGYKCVTDDTGTPIWSSQAIPKIAGDQPAIAEEKVEHKSWHSGFGWSRALVPNAYHYSVNCDASRPRQIIMGPAVYTATAAGNVVDFVELGSTFWVAATRYLQAINTSTDAIATPDNSDYTKGADFGAGAVISTVLPWDSLINVWFSSATNGRTFTGSTAPTELSGASVRRVFACKFFSEKSAKFVQAGSTTVSSDPVVTWIAEGSALDSAIGANWVAAYTIGDDTKAITGMAGSKTMVWVAKPDGLYYVDGRSGKTPRVVEALPTHANNGENLFVDATDNVWYPSSGGLYRYNPHNGEVWDVTPGRGLSNQSPIYGRCTALAQYKGWYYASIYNGTDSYIMVGREREENEPGIGPLIWHGALVKVTGAQITCMYVLGLTSPPRLYFGYGTTVAYIRLPDKADNPLQSPGYRYASSGSVYLSAENMGTVGSRYDLAGIVVQCKRFSVNAYADIYGRIDNGDWRLIGRLNRNGRVFIPVPEGDWRFSDLELRIDFDRTQRAAQWNSGRTWDSGVRWGGYSPSTTTPEIWGISILATQRVYTRQLIQTSVWCSERALTYLGVRERRSGEQLANFLDRLSVAGPVKAVEYWTGSARETSVLVQPLKRRLVRYVDKIKNEEWGEAVDLTMVSRSSETVEVQAGQVYQWGTGKKWNSGIKWG